MDVSALIHDRTEEPAGLQYMVVVSVLIHALGLGAALFGPGHWLSPPPERKRDAHACVSFLILLM